MAQIDTPTAHIAAGGDSVWTVEATPFTGSPPETSRIHQIDPSTNKIAASIDVAFFVTGMTWAEGALWVSNGDQDSVAIIDPTSGATGRSVRVGRIPSVLTGGSAAVWVGSDRDAMVTRIDPTTVNVSTLDVGGTPGDIAANEDGVWVTVRPR